MLGKWIKLLSVMAGFACTAVAAQDFPSRPITIVVPYPAGGTSDSQVRMIQERLGKLLGQPVIVENKAGASGAIGTQYVARAKPDGHTLLYPNTGLLMTPLLSNSAGYDPIKDFKPISMLTSVPLVLVVNKSIPANTLGEFIQYAKAQPKGIQFGSAGTTSLGHIQAARFAQMANLKAEGVPYKGEAQTTMALRSGEVQMTLTSPSAAMIGQVNQGNLKILGVSTSKPSPLLPGIPPIGSAVPGFSSEIWFGLIAPAGTPDDVVRKLNLAVKAVMEEPEIRAKLTPTGAVAQTSTPAQMAKILADETAELRDLIAKYNIKAE